MAFHFFTAKEFTPISPMCRVLGCKRWMSICIHSYSCVCNVFVFRDVQCR